MTATLPAPRRRPSDAPGAGRGRAAPPRPGTPAALRALLVGLVLLLARLGRARRLGGHPALLRRRRHGHRRRAAQPRRAADVPDDRRRRRDRHRDVPGQPPAAARASCSATRATSPRPRPTCPPAGGRRPEPGDERRARRARPRACRSTPATSAEATDRVRDGLPADRRLVPPGRLGGGAPGAAARRQDRLRPGRTTRSGRPAARRPGCRSVIAALVLALITGVVLVPGAAVADQAHQPRAQPRAGRSRHWCSSSARCGWRPGSSPRRSDLDARDRARLRPRRTWRRRASACSRSGATPCSTSSRAAATPRSSRLRQHEQEVGPGPAACSATRPRRRATAATAAALVAAAQRDATAWYAANAKVYTARPRRPTTPPSRPGRRAGASAGGRVQRARDRHHQGDRRRPDTTSQSAPSAARLGPLPGS